MGGRVALTRPFCPAHTNATTDPCAREIQKSQEGGEERGERAVSRREATRRPRRRKNADRPSSSALLCPFPSLSLSRLNDWRPLSPFLSPLSDCFLAAPLPSFPLWATGVWRLLLVAWPTSPSNPTKKRNTTTFDWLWNSAHASLASTCPYFKKLVEESNSDPLTCVASLANKNDITLWYLPSENRTLTKARRGEHCKGLNKSVCVCLRICLNNAKCCVVCTSVMMTFSHESWTPIFVRPCPCASFIAVKRNVLLENLPS